MMVPWWVKAVRKLGLMQVCEIKFKMEVLYIVHAFLCTIFYTTLTVYYYYYYYYYYNTVFVY